MVPAMVVPWEAAVPPVKFSSADQMLPLVSVYWGPPALTRQVEDRIGVEVAVKVGVAVGGMGVEVGLGVAEGVPGVGGLKSP